MSADVRAKKYRRSGVSPIAANSTIERKQGPSFQSPQESLPHLPMTHKGYLDVRVQVCQEHRVSEDGEIADFVALTG